MARKKAYKYTYDKVEKKDKDKQRVFNYWL